jgi:hypothetical protein
MFEVSIVHVKDQENGQLIWISTQQIACQGVWKQCSPLFERKIISIKTFIYKKKANRFA